MHCCMQKGKKEGRRLWPRCLTSGALDFVISLKVPQEIEVMLIAWGGGGGGCLTVRLDYQGAWFLDDIHMK
jgi:hypothetical protein